jgi:thioredoxin/glutathione reductase (selenoprotein)
MRDRWELRNDYHKMHVKEANPARPPLEAFRTVKSAIWPLKLYDNLNPTIDRNYDYDLVVIGGGSGGLACSKEAARLGARVAVLDYVRPTPYGSRWGIGGTCVNVGCIPKKLYHTAAIYGHYLEEAGHFGWQSIAGGAVTSGDKQCNWEVLRRNIQNHIKSLNNGYITGLKSAQVEYINARGSFIDPHTILCDATCNTCGCKDDVRKTKITARRVVIAVGGRPQYPSIPGAREFGITSDDIFSLEKSPGRTLVVGASYIALECGGFLTGLGYDTSVMVRSMVLRGFDRDCAERIKDDMKLSGTRFIEKCVPVQIEAAPDGSRKVTYEHAETKQRFVDNFDTVVFAIGREPVTKELNLEKAKVKVAPDGKIWTWNERTTAPHIYALGDVSHGTPELTPVAIKQGLTLAKRIYNRSLDDLVNLHNVPTTVFTPLEYGSIGMSEEKAIETFGEDNIEVYHSEFTPLEFTVPSRKTRCYAKLIVNYLDHERVIGFHYMGPNAGEVTQGFASAFLAGLTLSQWNLIVGIHPVCAEEMVSLRRTKRSGMDPKKTGC